MSRSAGPFRAAPATMGETATTRVRRDASASRTPGTASRGPMETTGFDGHTTMMSAPSSDASTPGAGLVAGAPSKRTSRTGTSWLQAHEVVLERDLCSGRPQRARLRQCDPCAQRVVGHRQQPNGDAAAGRTAAPSPC